MKRYSIVEAVCLGITLALASILTVAARAQAAQSITLEPPTGLDLQAHAMDSNGNLLPEAPANFRRLGEATLGRPADLRALTLRFNQTTRITGLSLSKDFRIEQGGSCVEGNVYEKGSTCRLLVRLTPEGPGNRLGKLTVNHTASATPDVFGLGGYAYMPVISFIPSVITTVPGTHPNNSGLLNGATDLSVDGGDTLYVADTGNNAIRMMDSGGKFQTISVGTISTPMGVAADSFGEVFFSEPNSNLLYEIFANNGAQIVTSGTGTAEACTDAASPCQLSNEQVHQPGHITIIPGDTMFFNENGVAERGVAISQIHPEPATFARLFDPFAYFVSPMSAFAADQYGNLFTAYDGVDIGLCEIVMQNLGDAEQARRSWSKIAGGRTCGFSGDGGLAQNAEISTAVGQIAFDVYGNLYFTDSNNQRVRRIDRMTGIIRTVAGNGIAGYTNDYWSATNAELANPTGVAVDSQGQVYIISGVAATGSAQVVRKVGANGFRNLGTIVKGTHSLPSAVIVSNTGNQAMTLANAAFTGANATDFAVDPASTSCLLAPGTSLNAGQTCQIGFIFTPSASGARNANFVLLNNTVNNSSVIQLTGTGTLAAATFKITSPTNGASFSSGTTIPFSVSAISSSSPAPTGTVQFKVDGTNLGSPVTISAGGAASASISGLARTSHTLSATYSGDSHYAAGGPVSITISVTATIPHPILAHNPQLTE